MKSKVPMWLPLLILISAANAFAQDSPPTLRLPHVARPIQYQAHLVIDPTEDSFSGDLTIDLQLLDKISILWLNGTDLEIVQAEILEGGTKKKTKLIPVQGNDFIGFSFPDPIGPGQASMQIKYRGKISDKDIDGLFKMPDRGAWYAYTQFEPISARRVFPSFDEPSYKVPWQMQITIPKDLTAVFNTPAESESVDGQMKTIRFAVSKPLPTYLVALGVGPFDFVDGGKIGKNGTPFRIVTPKGRAVEARWVAESTPQILSLLEEYFGSPYPYEKLDQLVIPKVGFAMEHPGLVTYGEYILMKPENETVAGRRSYASVCAHELAHQWFGDLVTMTWWDDIWLNESFASWMTTKILMQWKPDWDEQITDLDYRSTIMKEDSLITARKIRQPIESNDDIQNAFDTITYGKGAAILQMFESWIGEEKFQTGIRQYLNEYAWGNATANDFLNSIGKAADLEVAAAFSTFLDQTGVPLIASRMECTQGASPMLNLQMCRYLPLGSTGSSHELWQIPVCVKYGIENGQKGECFLLDEESKQVVMKDVGSCPGWFFANRNGWGYYHVKYPADQLKQLLNNGGKVLTIAERMSLINDFDALMQSGQMPASEVLSYIPVLLEDPNRYIINGTSEILTRMRRPLVSDEIRPQYARFIRNLYSPKAMELGWTSKPNDDENTKLLRGKLLPFVVDEGEDRELAAQAAELANGWLADRKAVEPEMVGAVLCSAATYGNKKFFDSLYREAIKTTDPTEREHILNAMACFQDPKLAASALSVLLDKKIDIRESIYIAWIMESYPDKNNLVYGFVTKNFNALSSRLPRDYVPYLSATGTMYCDEKHRSEIELFFRERMSKVPGGPRILDQTLEEIELCSSLRKAQQPSMIEFLKSYDNRSEPAEKN